MGTVKINKASSQLYQFWADHRKWVVKEVGKKRQQVMWKEGSYQIFTNCVMMGSGSKFNHRIQTSCWGLAEEQPTLGLNDVVTYNMGTTHFLNHDHSHWVKQGKAPEQSLKWLSKSVWSFELKDHSYKTSPKAFLNLATINALAW